MSEVPNTAPGANGNRYYYWPPDGERELFVPSVTTILKAGLPKPFLKPWGERKVAEYAVANLDVLNTLVERGGTQAAVDLCRFEPFRFTNEAASKGTIVHNALEAYNKGEAEHNITDPVSLNKYKGARRFLTDCVLEVFCAEGTVYSREHEYAGSCDLFGLVKLPKWEAPRPAVVDYKTSKKVYDEVGFQLAAYGNADFINLVPGHEEEPPVESPLPKVECGIVVRPTEEGGYQYKVFEFTDDLFKTFLRIREVAFHELVLREAKARLVTVK